MKARWASWGIAIVAIVVGVVRADDFYEGSSVTTTQWGSTWNPEFVEWVLAKVDSPLIDVSAEVRLGESTSRGVQYIWVDTLVVTVSGPRQEVLDALVCLDQLIKLE